MLSTCNAFPYRRELRAHPGSCLAISGLVYAIIDVRDLKEVSKQATKLCGITYKVLPFLCQVRVAAD